MSTDAIKRASSGVGIPWVNPWVGIVQLWRHRPQWAGWFILGMFAIFTIFLAVTIVTTTPHLIDARPVAGLGDIDNQREFGRRLLAGEDLYGPGFCYNYMPIAGLYWAPMALVPPAMALVGRYVISLWATWFIFYALARMLRGTASPRRWDHVTCVALAMIVGLHFVLRDLTDGGAHLTYVAMMIGGVYCAWQGRDKLAAGWLGLAIALKCTPGLFLPFLIWKGKWRLAAYTTLATLLWIALPACTMGPQAWWKEQQKFNTMALSVFTDKLDQSRVGNELVPSNQSLKLMVLRYLTAGTANAGVTSGVVKDDALPPGGPADVTLLNLPEKAGKAVFGLVVLGLLGGFAWWSRRRYTRADDPRWVVEASGVIFLALILSPVIGMRHAVFAVPALYLLAVHAQGFRRLDRVTLVLLGVYLAIEVLMNRAMIGKPLYMVLLSFRVHMVSFLLLWAMFVRTRPIVSALPEAGGAAESPRLRGAAKAA